MNHAADRMAELLEYQMQMLKADGVYQGAQQLRNEAKQLRLLAKISVH